MTCDNGLSSSLRRNVLSDVFAPARHQTAKAGNGIPLRGQVGVCPRSVMTMSWMIAMGGGDFARTALVYAPMPDLSDGEVSYGWTGLG